MSAQRKKYLQVALWSILIVALAIAVPFGWSFLGLVLVVGFPVVVIIIVVRSAIVEFWGKGPEHRRDPMEGVGASQHASKRTAIERGRAITPDDGR